MGLLELFLIAVGLSMDAFAVAVCTGLSFSKITFEKSFIVGLYFGIFQGLMPMIGYVVGSQFADAISDYDHWIAFVLLALIGGRMAIGALKEEDGEKTAPIKKASLTPLRMLPLSIATSIDALAIGVSFSFLQVNIVYAALFIGVTTLILSMLGVKIGVTFGTRFKSKAEFSGGAILILIGLKILLEHIGILSV